MYDLQWLHMQYWDRFYIYVHNNKIIVIEDLLWNSLIDLIAIRTLLLFVYSRNGFREGTVPKPRRSGAAAPSTTVAAK